MTASDDLNMTIGSLPSLALKEAPYPTVFSNYRGRWEKMTLEEQAESVLILQSQIEKAKEKFLALQLSDAKAACKNSENMREHATTGGISGMPDFKSKKQATFDYTTHSQALKL